MTCFVGTRAAFARSIAGVRPLSSLSRYQSQPPTKHSVTGTLPRSRPFSASTFRGVAAELVWQPGEPVKRFLPSLYGSMAERHASPLVWIDCEMTGLDPEKEEIIEIFCLITNGDLELLDEDGWGTVVHQPKARMDQMDDWCVRTHGQTGLTASVIASTVTPEQAAEGLLEYVKKYVPDAGKAILAGNSVHADKSFLVREPYRKVTDYLHYRIMDVSSIKEAIYRWCPGHLDKAPRKQYLHKAKEDILESIAEARYYKEAIFQASQRQSQELQASP